LTRQRYSSKIDLISFSRTGRYSIIIDQIISSETAS
jgi:hypothetical protein